jgi:hypothetical protein
MFDVYETHLQTGRSKGCKPCATVTHGMSKSPTWISWQAMKHRCDLESHPKFNLYGGRGITYADEWNKFEKFLEDMGPRPRGMTLDRLDSNKNYSKDNCRWATQIEQNNNRSCNALIEHDGEIFTKANLARHLGISYPALLGRLKNGKPIDAPYKQRKSPRK